LDSTGRRGQLLAGQDHARLSRRRKILIAGQHLQHLFLGGDRGCELGRLAGISVCYGSRQVHSQVN
jgi:hypothetical protein